MAAQFTLQIFDQVLSFWKTINIFDKHQSVILYTYMTYLKFTSAFSSMSCNSMIYFKHYGCVAKKSAKNCQQNS